MNILLILKILATLGVVFGVSYLKLNEVIRFIISIVCSVCLVGIATYEHNTIGAILMVSLVMMVYISFTIDAAKEEIKNILKSRKGK